MINNDKRKLHNGNSNNPSNKKVDHPSQGLVDKINSYFNLGEIDDSVNIIDANDCSNIIVNNENKSQNHDGRNKSNNSNSSEHKQNTQNINYATNNDFQNRNTEKTVVKSDENDGNENGLYGECCSNINNKIK